MGSSTKRPRADDTYERELLPEPSRLKPHDARPNLMAPDPSHQESHYNLPRPPARAGRLRGSPQKAQGENKFGTVVKKFIAPNEYEHKPLSLNPQDDEIRLLILRSGNSGDRIQCRFLVLPLSRTGAEYNHEYEALSYYWGTELADREIKIENLDPERNLSHLKKLSPKLIRVIRPQSFYIRPNLHEALIQLRDKRRDIVLWVDALCINQEDEREKTMQVQKMARIYSRASQVLVWLGPSITTHKSIKRKCEEALDFIDEILDLNSFDAKVKDEKSPPKWAALVELMRCDWFSRRWVVQELALASDATLLYNGKEINWKDFADAVAMFTTRFDAIKQLFLYSREFDHNIEYLGDIQALGANTLIDVIANHFRRSSEAQDNLERLSNLEALVSRLLKFEASDPRDTVYALLSICKEKQDLEGSLSPGSHYVPVSDSTRPQNKLVPDYKKSIIEVYKDFTDYCVSTSDSIDIICRHWAPAEPSKSATLGNVRIQRKKKEEKQIEMSMPSWVPLLTDSAYGAPHQDQRSRVNGDSLVGHPDRKCYNASGDKRPEVRFERFERVPPGPENISVEAFFMFVKGIQIDTVTKVSSRIPPGLLTQECLEMGGWNGSNDPRDGVPDELWRTLVAGRGADGTNPPGWYHRACWDCFHLGTSSGDVNIGSLITNPRTPSLMVEFLKRVSGIVWDRVFVRSQEKRLFGLGPRGTQLGDLICVLFGCSVPVILRPQIDPSGSEPTHYKVIGESYIYGHMDGEAILKFLPETHPQEFPLG